MSSHPPPDPIPLKVHLEGDPSEVHRMLQACAAGLAPPRPRRLTLAMAREVRRLAQDGLSRRDLAARFDVLPEAIGDVLSGRTWKEPA